MRGCQVEPAGTAKMWSLGLVNFITALDYHFCLALPAAFTKPRDHFLAEFCKGMRALEVASLASCRHASRCHPEEDMAKSKEKRMPKLVPSPDTKIALLACMSTVSCWSDSKSMAHSMSGRLPKGHWAGMTVTHSNSLNSKHGVTVGRPC